MRCQAAIAVLLLCGAACHPNTALVEVSVANIPAGARQLLLSVRLGNDVAAQISPFPILGDGVRTVETLALRLPTTAGLTLRLVVGAGVVDINACPQAIGLTQVDYHEQALSLVVPLEAAPPSTQTVCSLQQPLIFGVTPSSAPSSGNTPLSIHGWGFDPAALALVDQLPLSLSTWKSANEITGEVPAAPGVYGHRPIRVNNPDDSSTVNSTLFSYYAAVDQIKLQGSKCVEASLSGSSHFLFSVGPVLGQSTAPDLVRIDQESGQVEVFPSPIGGLSIKPTAVQSLGVVPRAATLVAKTATSASDLVYTTNGDGGIILFGNQGAPALFNAQPPLRTFVDLAPAAVSSVVRRNTVGSDLVVADAAFDEVNILFRQSDGGFSRRARASFSVDREPVTVLIADVNRDAQPDIIVGHKTANVINVLLQTPGSPQTPWPGLFEQVSVPTTYHALAVGDFDGDGTADLIFADERPSAAGTPSTIRIYYMTPGDRPSVGGIGTIPNLPLLTSLLAVDLNGDGKSEIIAGFAQSPTLQVFTRDSSGMINLLQNTFMPTPMDKVTALSSVYHDAEHLIDFLAADETTGAVTCWQNKSM